MELFVSTILETAKEDQTFASPRFYWLSLILVCFCFFEVFFLPVFVKFSFSKILLNIGSKYFISFKRVTRILLHISLETESCFSYIKLIEHTLLQKRIFHFSLLFYWISKKWNPHFAGSLIHHASRNFCWAEIEKYLKTYCLYRTFRVVSGG